MIVVPKRLRYGLIAAAVMTSISVPAAAVAVTGSRVPARQRIFLSASHGTATTAIRVRGTGFGHAEKVVLFFGSTRERVTRTGKSGRFGPLTISVPVSAQPGRHAVNARGERTGRAASAWFTVPTDSLNWPQSRFDAGQDGNDARENILSPADVKLLHQDWAFTATSDIESGPVIANGLAYIMTDDYHLDAVSASTGKLAYSIGSGYSQPSPTPAVYGGMIYFSTPVQARLYAVDAATGGTQGYWAFTTGGQITASPTVTGGVVYVDSDQLYALSAATGRELWSYPAPGAWASPAVADGIVYFGSTDDSVYAINAATGAKVWSFATGGAIASSPAVADGVVYVGSNDGSVYALNATTGQEEWHVSTGDGFILSSPAVADGLVYIGGLDDRLYALDATTGAIRWTLTTSTPVAASPAVAHGVVYIGVDRTLYALNAKTGAKLWSATTANVGATSPAIAGGKIYIGFGNKLYVFGLK